MKKTLTIMIIILLAFFVDIAGNPKKALGIEIHDLIPQGYLETTTAWLFQCPDSPTAAPKLQALEWITSIPEAWSGIYRLTALGLG